LLATGACANWYLGHFTTHNISQLPLGETEVQDLQPSVKYHDLRRDDARDHIPSIQNVSCFVMGERSMSGRIGREKLGPGDCDQEHLQNGAAEEGFKNSQDPGPNVSRKK